MRIKAMALGKYFVLILVWAKEIFNSKIKSYIFEFQAVNSNSTIFLHFHCVKLNCKFEEIIGSFTVGSHPAKCNKKCQNLYECNYRCLLAKIGITSMKL